MPLPTTEPPVCYHAPDSSEVFLFMQGENKERWKQLCEEAAIEQDPTRLSELVREINSLLEEKELRGLVPTKTERSNCHFAVQRIGGRPLLVVQLFQDTIPMLKGASLGFDLLGGTRIEDAKKMAEMLNEHIIDMFVTTGEKSA
jgi:hypothetical protein